MEQFTDCSIDLETLSTQPNAIIISLGAVAFNLDEIDLLEDLESESRTFHCYFELNDQLHRGRIMDPDTIMWWMKQNTTARFAIAEAARVHVVTGLSAFTEQCKTWGVTRFWGNGAGFDNVILRNMYEAYGLLCPMKFYNDMDLRTIKMLADYDGKDLTRGTKHDALADAAFQAQVAQFAFRKLNHD